MPYQAEKESPESPRAAVLRQAVKGMHRDPSPSSRSEHVYIDPKSALGQSASAPFGYGVLFNSSQNSYHGQQGGDQVDSLDASANTLNGFGFSSCDEDADGEPDNSFTSQHSFWTTHPGDTSVSTVDTVDLDDTPVPLLGRDGRWKGGTPPSKVATHFDLQSQNHRYASTPRTDHSLYHADRVESPTIQRSAPYQGTRLKRAEAEPDGHAAPSFGSAEKRLDDQQDTQQDTVQQGGSTSINTAARAKRTSKKQSKRHKPSKKAKASRNVSSDDRRQASSEVGSGSSARTFSSPASSLGRYRLRRKESVPVLSLAELLTPPPAKPSSPSDEAVLGSVEWQDEGYGDAAHRLQHDREAHRSRREYVEAQPDELKEGETIDDRVYASASGHFDRGQDELSEANPTIDVEAAAQGGLEESLQPEMGRDRGTRTFPVDWEIHPDFPLLYQRYSVPSSVSPEVLEMLLRHVNYANVDQHFRDVVDRAQRSHGAFNKPRSILDLYTPRFVKGVSAQKVGMCPICYEDGKVKFLKTKFSAYNYHLQNFHGVSAFTGLPFTPPTHFRGKRRTNVKPTERAQIIQGLCHCCHKYIDMQGPKATEIKVPEIYWWKHAQACHRKGTTPEGVGGYFVEDSWFERVCSVLELIDGYDSEIAKLLSNNK
ncbi:related to Meiotic expression upregulated protein 26 [Sporisorium reilianum f. sp. reilianum]|uniref:Related to Meiotic expression upregulated protein 26 n=1 Tax=Sporisorium reilianum f. sp. reilianum TaxID=72559 RepID=A0A2N8UGA3_9BASI|nr:related to Meiotic expression upregulated protein 26 [Sporisorium reilianum f. sp. reilianum]